jgi:hypothetical protein
MAYAPHDNQDVRLNPTLPLILGQFKEVEYGQTFEFGLRPKDDQFFCPDMPHLVYISSRSDLGTYRTRYGKVLKTVAYIVTDEDEDGPIVTKWFIKGHRLYQSAVRTQA